MVGFKTLKYNLIYGVIIILFIAAIVSRARISWEGHKDKKMTKRVILLILNILIGIIISMILGALAAYFLYELEKGEGNK